MTREKLPLTRVKKKTSHNNYLQFFQYNAITQNTNYFLASCVYNIEQEIVTAELHTKENEIATFNPFNNTIVTVSSTSARSHYTVTDLRTMKDIWVPQKSSNSSDTLTIRYTKIVDENTMLILGYAPDYLRGGRYGRLTTAVGFVDLRTGSETEIVKYALRPNYINYEVKHNISYL